MSQEEVLVDSCVVGDAGYEILCLLATESERPIIPASGRDKDDFASRRAVFIPVRHRLTPITRGLNEVTVVYSVWCDRTIQDHFSSSQVTTRTR